MSDYIIAQTDILERELSEYEQIIVLLKHKQNYLVESNPQGIKTATHEIEEVISKIRTLEKERARLLDSFITEKLTRPATDPATWRKTIPGDSTPEHELIEAFNAHENVKARLRHVLAEVANLQSTNQMLIQQGCDVLQSCIECLLSQVSQDTYDKKGVSKKSEIKNSIIDQRI